ncbi:hypothetical protein [Hwanghaeella sp. LZ110]|jgi:hypothetical protein|uniref:hypothetical protein n=1 Tax=Hwanghaeella sp. LZ110 TaxID=3402810 RepID=UPI003B674C06
MFTEKDIIVKYSEDMSAGDVVTLELQTPEGSLILMGNVTRFGRGVLLVEQVHIESVGASPMNRKKLNVMAAVVMEELDVNTIEIQGAVRTSGANPGRRPKPFPFDR